MSVRLEHGSGWDIWVSKKTYARQRPPPGTTQVATSVDSDSGLLGLSVAGFRIIVEQETGTEEEAKEWAKTCVGKCWGFGRFWGFTSLDDAFAFRMRFT